MRRASHLVAIAAVAAVAACGKSKLMARVGEAVLPECDQTVAAAAGPDVVLMPLDEEEGWKLPAGPVVRIAADRGVSWRRVKQLADRLTKQGSRPVYLVGLGLSSDIGAFEPTEALRPGRHLVMDTTKDGGFFVGPADTQIGTRVQSFDQLHISKSSIREAMGPIVDKTGIHDVEVRVDPHLNWVDLVRAIDGSRTCCPGVEMRATLMD